MAIPAKPHLIPAIKLPGAKPSILPIKPKITIDIEGMNPIVIAPYGFPGPNKWGQVKTGAGIGSALLLAGFGFLVYKAIKRK